MVTVMVRPLGEPKKTKKERRNEGSKKDSQNSGKLVIRPDLACRLISIELCMVVGLWCLVIPVKCDVSSKSVKGLRRCGMENGP